jgi:hypothetical protein
VFEVEQLFGIDTDDQRFIDEQVQTKRLSIEMKLSRVSKAAIKKLFVVSSDFDAEKPAHL